MITMITICPKCSQEHEVPMDTEWVTCSKCGLPMLVLGCDASDGEDLRFGGEPMDRKELDLFSGIV